MKILSLRSASGIKDLSKIKNFFEQRAFSYFIAPVYHKDLGQVSVGYLVSPFSMALKLSVQ